MSDHFVGFRKLVSQFNKDSFVFFFCTIPLFWLAIEGEGLEVSASWRH